LGYQPFIHFSIDVHDPRRGELCFVRKRPTGFRRRA
jgi:hypothetical protein